MSSTAKENGHFGSTALDELHKKVDGLGKDTAACLSGHMSYYGNFQNEKSCNYRYQCYESNKANAAIKARLERYKTLPAESLPESIETESKRAPRNLADWFRKYAFNIPGPRPNRAKGDWDIGGPDGDIERKGFFGTRVCVESGKNFTKALWPYFNNAHHIISKGTLKGVIAKKANSEFIQQGLLEGKYNINDGKNMVFLPMDKVVGTILHLPRHLTSRAAWSHKSYDEVVKLAASVGGGEAAYRTAHTKGLINVIDEFDRVAARAKKSTDGTHDLVELDLVKAMLEDLSEDLLDTILAWGELASGEALDFFS